MQSPDATGASVPTIAETLAKLGADDKTGLTDAEVRLFFAIVATQIAAVFMCSQGLLDPARSWKQWLFEPLRRPMTGRPNAVR
jgi:hypothetical protein